MIPYSFSRSLIATISNFDWTRFACAPKVKPKEGSTRKSQAMHRLCVSLNHPRTLSVLS
jgi:hypothetical protein